MHRFQYLKTGLAMVLAFVGTKMLVADIYKVPIGVSLAVVAALIGGSVIVSLVVTSRRGPAPSVQPGETTAGPA